MGLHGGTNSLPFNCTPSGANKDIIDSDNNSSFTFYFPDFINTWEVEDVSNFCFQEVTCLRYLEVRIKIEVINHIPNVIYLS